MTTIEVRQEDRNGINHSIVMVGDHVVHECEDADCLMEETLAHAIGALVKQQKRHEKRLYRVMTNFKLNAFLFVADLAFLAWHVELFFSGHEGH